MSRPRLMADLEADGSPIPSGVNRNRYVPGHRRRAAAGHGQHSPIDSFSSELVTVIENPGKDNMEIIVKDAQKLDRYKASGQGQSAKAGAVAYVPAAGEAGAAAPASGA